MVAVGDHLRAVHVELDADPVAVRRPGRALLRLPGRHPQHLPAARRAQQHVLRARAQRRAERRDLAGCRVQAAARHAEAAPGVLALRVAGADRAVDQPLVAGRQARAVRRRPEAGRGQAERRADLRGHQLRVRQPARAPHRQAQDRRADVGVVEAGARRMGEAGGRDGAQQRLFPLVHGAGEQPRDARLARQAAGVGGQVAQRDGARLRPVADRGRDLRHQPGDRLVQLQHAALGQAQRDGHRHRLADRAHPVDGGGIGAPAPFAVRPAGRVGPDRAPGVPDGRAQAAGAVRRGRRVQRSGQLPPASVVVQLNRSWMTLRTRRRPPAAAR